MLIGQAVDRMSSFYSGDPKRINHFLKVYAYAKSIGELEELDSQTQETLELAAVLHDIGIKPSEEKYGNCNGPNQEKEGPPIADALMRELGIAPERRERVCYLIAHHHTYHEMKGLDYQILVEADFLVNMDEEQLGKKEIKSVEQKIFRTKAGIALLHRLFGSA